MKLIVWNIQQGGGPRRDRIAEAIIAQEPDLVAMIELEPNTAAPLVASLQSSGLRQDVCTQRNGRDYVICAMAKQPITPRVSGIPLLDESGLCLDLLVPTYGFGLAVIHVPTAGNRKRPYCDALVQFAHMRKQEPLLIAGDFNTGMHPEDGDLKSLGGADRFEAIQKAGFTDAWRHLNGDRQEFTLTRNSKGYRIDHALASDSMLPRINHCHYSHRERLAGLSDHSVLMVDITPR